MGHWLQDFVKIWVQAPGWLHYQDTAIQTVSERRHSGLVRTIWIILACLVVIAVCTTKPGWPGVTCRRRKRSGTGSGIAASEIFMGWFISRRYPCRPFLSADQKCHFYCCVPWQYGKKDVAVPHTFLLPETTTMRAPAPSPRARSPVQSPQTSGQGALPVSGLHRRC